MGSNPVGQSDEDQTNSTRQDGPGTGDRANSVAQDENLYDDTGEIQAPARNNENTSNDDLDEFTRGEKPQLEEESVRYMDDTVDKFRRGEITKLKALSNIIGALNFDPSKTNRAKDSAIEIYAKTLDEYAALSSSAIKRGNHAAVGLDPKSVQPEQREPKNVDANRAIDELISQSVETATGRKGGTPLQDLMMTTMETNPQIRNEEFSNPRCPGIIERKKPDVAETEIAKNLDEFSKSSPTVDPKFQDCAARFPHFRMGQHH
ncbi:uncharacterized protein LACBIDRAFT_335936 [Laccaria bicolor S238N-H82]|uniref:Predicted protein n=1 Tax=Laccaria bicolor (strain S238N-H82 / ATCC MYA-4686) TaxID=486041 RepID=B0E3W1_LACBS|nr:uncharacterized protein LACBIDRAFT_335936 [Laccaria bicolor S238N-H82]EDQ98468.1 predicted protein [Laccaria bicolor S238N-H82]|eukprot:XP_001890879.1 predicted protein [Laccaria bicolor S238N-H82]